MWTSRTAYVPPTRTFGRCQRRNDTVMRPAHTLSRNFGLKFMGSAQRQPGTSGRALRRIHSGLLVLSGADPKAYCWASVTGVTRGDATSGQGAEPAADDPVRRNIIVAVQSISGGSHETSARRFHDCRGRSVL